MRTRVNNYNGACRKPDIILACAFCLLAFTVPAYGSRYPSLIVGQSQWSHFTDRLIIKLRDDSSRHHIAGVSSVQVKLLDVADRVRALSIAAGVTGLRHLREMSGGAQVLELPGMLPLAQVKEMTRRLAENPDVEYVEPDLIMWPMAVPNDPYYSLQWNFHSSISEAGAVNLPAAWDINTGIPVVTVAVIDTGIVPHTDLINHIVPGYDFITDVLTANDGDGRDNDPTDPGDWVSADESSGIAAGGYFAGCPQSISSWHGTHIAGIIGAVSDNHSGVAGVNWNARILPVRVLGKCGGYSSDIIDGIRWAAGFAVSGVPTNSKPADVLNLSFAGVSSCTTAYQNAIDDVVGAGKVIVVAAGNSTIDANSQVPANCENVITVAANNRAGGLASYSNFGDVVDITAPGGDYPLNPDGIPSTLDQGDTNALNDNTYSYYRGTSLAAPHVSGIASLMLSANYEITGTLLAPNLIEQKIKTTARVFPAGTGTDCTTTLCGAGIIDAYAAVSSVVTPPTAEAGVDQDVNTGATVSLDASSSSDDGAISTFSWLQTSGTSVSLNDANSATPAFTAPQTADVLTFELTVTDDVGISATDTVAITVNAHNKAPVSSEGKLTMYEGSTGDAVLVASDSDGDILTYSIVTNGIMGTAVITDANTGSYYYTPDPDASGTDSFTFKANDGSQESNIATISVTINRVNNSATITSSRNQAQAGGGGGSMGPMTMIFGLIVLLLRRRRSFRAL